MGLASKVLAVFLVLFLISACTPTIEKPLKIPKYTSKTLIISNNFNSNQIEYIYNAAKSWECETGGIIHFDIKTNAEVENYNKYIFIFPVNKDNELIKEKDEKIAENNFITMGVAINAYPKSILIVNERVQDYLYTTLVIHEIGHQLGLEHSINKKSVMYPSLPDGAKYITKLDIKNFCDLYNCYPEYLTKCGENNE